MLHIEYGSFLLARVGAGSLLDEESNFTDHMGNVASPLDGKRSAASPSEMDHVDIVLDVTYVPKIGQRA